jgi:hypothetical protein
MKIKKGDILLPSGASGGEGKLSYVIAKASQRKGEGKTRATHVDIVSTDGELLPDNMGEIRVIGMTYPRMREADLSIYKGVEVIIYRLVSADPVSMDCMVTTLKNYVSMGKKYGVWNILLHGLDAGFNWLLERFPWYESDLRPFTTLFFSEKAICSSLVAELYLEYFDISFGRKVRQVQPDDIDDFCSAYPRVFKHIYTGEIE